MLRKIYIASSCWWLTILFLRINWMSFHFRKLQHVCLPSQTSQFSHINYPNDANKCDCAIVYENTLKHTQTTKSQGHRTFKFRCLTPQYEQTPLAHWENFPLKSHCVGYGCWCWWSLRCAAAFLYKKLHCNQCSLIECIEPSSCIDSYTLYTLLPTKNKTKANEYKKRK